MRHLKISKKKIYEIIEKYNINIFDQKIDDEIEIDGISTFYNYKEKTFTWIKNKEIFEKNKYKKNIEFIILPKEIKEFNNFKNYISSNTPKELFFLILKEVFKNEKKFINGRGSIISEKANIKENVVIGNNCTIEENVIIDSGTLIGNNVVIKNNTNIGKNCVIQSGAIIGEEGFGFIEINNLKKRVPHIGGVQIGNEVEIGANTCIVRGVIEDTILEDNVKIDNLCHIAHNVVIKKNTSVVAQTLVAGSAKIGENSWISTSCIRNQILVGDNCLVGLGAVVVKNVENNSIVFGNPAKKGGSK